LWPELLRYFGEFQAAATFTLSDQTGVLGSFVIHSKQEYFRTERLRRMATVAADTAAALLRNQTQAYEYWRRTADHDFLEDLDSKLLDSPVPEDPEESRDWLRHVIEDLCQKFEADWGALFLADRAGERLILHTSYNWYAKNVEGKVEYRIREGWTGNVAVNSGDIISVLKDSHYRATQKYHDYIEPPEARGKPGEVAPRVGIRLMAGQVLIGVLTLGYYFRNLRRFNALDRLSLSLLKSFGRRLTLALAVIRQIQLKKQIKTLSQSKKGVTDRLLAALQSDKSGDWQTAFDSLRELFRVEVVGYFELRDELKLRWSSPSKHKILDATPSVDVYGILQDVLQTQKAQLIPPNDVGVALYAIPVQGINEDVIGALAFLSTAQYLDAFPQFDEVEKETASDVAQTLGLAISTQNELLRKLTQATTMGATAIAGMLTAHNIEVPVTRLTGAVDDLAEAVDTKAPGSLTQEMFDHAVKVAGLTDAVQELMDARLDNREDILKCCRMVQMEARKLITEIKENAELAGEVVEPLPLSELLNSALERALGDVSSPNVRPSVDQVPDVRISVNRWMFVSALRNLLVNGLEALSNTGELTVRTELHTTSEVAIIIHNSGPRYTQPQVRTFFEPRSDKPGRHLGLGLKLAKQVMERAHGTLEVYAPDSGGVEVKVTLPCKPS
jgi:signal transduction histidine kinase